jgi:alanine-synthesizing transaminase
MFARRTEWPLEPNALTREIESRVERGLPLLDLTESNPTRCGFVYDSATILRALGNPAALLYQPEPRGPATARQVVAGYYAEHGAVINLEQIFVTASTSEAYSYVFRLLADPGEAVLVPRPSYPLFDFLAGLNDLEIIGYPLVYDPSWDSGWRIDLDELGSILRNAGSTSALPRALVVVHPNNPTGSFIHQGELETLADLCHRHHLALIADEVFADYALESAGAPDLGKWARTASHAGLDRVLTFTLSGLSKVSALPQMKLAWIVVSGPPDQRARALARLEIIADTYLSVSAPVAAALPDLLETRHAIQPQILTRLRQNLAALDSQLSPARQAARLKTEGGWYAVLGLPYTHEGKARNDDDWALHLAREDGVLVHPGHFYEFTSENHLVLSLLPAPDVFSEGIRRLAARLGGGS